MSGQACKTWDDWVGGFGDVVGVDGGCGIKTPRLGKDCEKWSCVPDVPSGGAGGGIAGYVFGVLCASPRSCKHCIARLEGG